MPRFNNVRGMRDFLPENAEKMSYIEQVARDIARLYGYREVITPIVESYGLLTAKSGEEIRERMYAFKDLGGRRVALRPEFTASIARLVASKMMKVPKPLRLFCAGSLYRYDEPQYGRYREFWQANYELLGSDRPEADAEILTLSYDLMERLGFRDYHFKIGHVGILRGILSQEGVKEDDQNRIMQLIDKKMWDEALTFAEGLKDSQECSATLKKLFETKGEYAPQVLEKAKDVVQGYRGAVASVENLQKILELTKVGGANLNMWVEMGFARGLEYYTGMIFELYVPEMDIALGGGGRYDKLIELFGGEVTPAVGVAPGIDRLMLALEGQKVPLGSGEEEKRVMVVPVSEDLMAKALEVSLTLRMSGVSAEVEVMGRKVSRALADADRRGVTHAVIMGPEEVKGGKVVLRDMKKREQKVVRIEDLSKEIGMALRLSGN
jgi:histidyl-tRNA synthetase